MAEKKVKNGKPVRKAVARKKPAARRAPVPKKVEETPQTPPAEAVTAEAVKDVKARRSDVRKMSMVERHRVGTAIIEARHQSPPVTWAQIAKDHLISERNAYRIYRDIVASRARLGDGSGTTVVEEDLNVTEMQIDQLAEDVANATAVTDRVAAIRQMSALMDRRLRLLAILGRMPRSFRAANELAKLQLLVQQFARMLDKHQIDPEIVREFVELAKGEYDSSEFEMRALTATAGE
jgi:hypothetical protein